MHEIGTGIDLTAHDRPAIDLCRMLTGLIHVLIIICAQFR